MESTLGSNSLNAIEKFHLVDNMFDWNNNIEVFLVSIQIIGGDFMNVTQVRVLHMDELERLHICLLNILKDFISICENIIFIIH